MDQVLPDIPRVHTGLAEWAACALYVWHLWRTRTPRKHAIAVLVLGLPALVCLQVAAGHAPHYLWLVGMAASVGAMALVVRWSTMAGWVVVGNLTARAFILAELLASFAWQLTVWFHPSASPWDPPSAALTAAASLLVLGPAWLLERRHFPEGERLHLEHADLWVAIAVATLTFAMSNLSFTGVPSPFSGQADSEVFYIRTLVDLCGFLVLYTQQERIRELAAAADLAAVQAQLRAQHDQYLQSKANIEAVSRAHHDLKHKIALIRAEVDPQRTVERFEELERSVGAIGVQYECGNPVLDVVLTSKAQSCAAGHITFTVVADGTLVAGLSAMDVATLFGNALDNAIEAALHVSDPDKRLIRLALHAKGTMTVLRVENYFDGTLVRDEDGELRTRKTEARGHGIGLRSIRWTARQHGGEVTGDVEGNWFTLTVLLPRGSVSE
ncbi:sensor histidine kinase [Schaalia sp. 19OD2882]|nr:sensor histidine kinase [Schaalia sp. 19OD2882]